LHKGNFVYINFMKSDFCFYILYGHRFWNEKWFWIPHKWFYHYRKVCVVPLWSVAPWWCDVAHPSLWSWGLSNNCPSLPIWDTQYIHFCKETLSLIISRICSYLWEFILDATILYEIHNIYTVQRIIIFGHITRVCLYQSAQCHSFHIRHTFIHTENSKVPTWRQSELLHTWYILVKCSQIPHTGQMQSFEPVLQSS